jgi:hypothetical protein
MLVNRNRLVAQLLFASAGGGILYGFTNFASLFLDVPQQFLRLAGHEFQFIIREPGALFFQFTPYYIAVALNLKGRHK